MRKAENSPQCQFEVWESEASKLCLRVTVVAPFTDCFFPFIMNCHLQVWFLFLGISFSQEWEEKKPILHIHAYLWPNTIYGFRHMWRIAVSFVTTQWLTRDLLFFIFFFCRCQKQTEWGMCDGLREGMSNRERRALNLHKAVARFPAVSAAHRRARRARWRWISTSPRR